MFNFPQIKNRPSSMWGRTRCDLVARALVGVSMLTLTTSSSRAGDLGELLEASSTQAASGIVRELQQSADIALTDVLGAMGDANATQKNWLISLAQVIADRDEAAAKQELLSFLEKDSQDSVARYWAFAFVTKGDKAARESFLAKAIEDSSLDIRYEAIELALENLENDESLTEDAKNVRLKDLLAKARLAEQVQEIGSKLEELGEPQDLLKHFGFIATWKILGPFDNVEMVGFSKEYPPESALQSGPLQAKAESLEGVEGKAGKLSWSEITTEDKDGIVDVSAALSKEKGAVAYLVGEFKAAEAVKCQFRIGTPNATKVWLNGDLILNREVYHSGNQIDQYIESVELKEGANEIVIKSCQNEQTQPWAQDWAFQARFTDETGKAIQPAK